MKKAGSASDAPQVFSIYHRHLRGGERGENAARVPRWIGSGAHRRRQLRDVGATFTRLFGYIDSVRVLVSIFCVSVLAGKSKKYSKACCFHAVQEQTC